MIHFELLLHITASLGADRRDGGGYGDGIIGSGVAGGGGILKVAGCGCGYMIGEGETRRVENLDRTSDLATLLILSQNRTL